MLDNLTPEAKQQAIRMYMQQQGGQANPANMQRMMQQLAANPQMAQAAANLFMGSQASMSDRAGSGTVGSRVDDLVSGMMARDGTVAPAAAPGTAPVAPGGGRGGGGGGGTPRGGRGGKRVAPAQVMTGMGTAARGGPDAVPGDIVNAPLPPVRPGELPQTPQVPPEGPGTDYGDILSKLLAASAIGAGGYGAYKMGQQQVPPKEMPPILPIEPGAPPARAPVPIRQAAPEGSIDIRNLTPQQPPMQGPRQPQGPIDAPQTVRQPQGPVDAPQTIRQPQGPEDTQQTVRQPQGPEKPMQGPRQPQGPEKPASAQDDVISRATAADPESGYEKPRVTRKAGSSKAEEPDADEKPMTLREKLKADAIKSRGKASTPRGRFK